MQRIRVMLGRLRTISDSRLHGEAPHQHNSPMDAAPLIIPATSPQCFAVTSVRLIDKKAWSRRSCSSTGSTRSRKCSSSTGQDRQSPTRSSQYRAAIPSSALSTSNWRRPRQRCLRQEAASSGSTSDPQSAEQRHHQPATARNN